MSYSFYLYIFIMYFEIFLKRVLLKTLLLYLMLSYQDYLLEYLFSLNVKFKFINFIIYLKSVRKGEPMTYKYKNIMKKKIMKI